MKAYYEYAGITIYHGDCREILATLPDVALLLTDPPYGIGAAHVSNFGHGVKRRMTGLVAGKCVPKRDYGDSDWDDEPADTELLKQFIGKSQAAIIFGGNYFDLGPARAYLVWDKLRGDTHYADGELAWTNLATTVRIYRYRWNGFLLDHPEDRFHPTQKPLDLMKWCIGLVGSPDSILDPYMGSGTTLIAAKLAGIPAIGIEREERYCEIAAKRLAQEVLNFEPEKNLASCDGN